jgi:PadR family transcriptional regulator
MALTSTDLLQGTLDLLILRALEVGELHGWAIARRLRDASGGALEVQQGSLYPALHRLERRRWLRSRWGVSDTGRRARFYHLTRGGTRQLAAQKAEWERFTLAVGRVLA